MTTLFRKALLKADEIRIQLGLNMFQPINIFDSCISLGISVRFVDINMEGMYIRQKNETHPTILISNQRPLPRRCFTCAHELGHHVFNHGIKLDVLLDEEFHSSSNESDELLVDSFAGALLMPIAGIQAEFAKRNWSPQKASAIQFYTICSVFGTGYKTLIVHCRVNKIINEQKASDLLKSTPAKILKSFNQPGTQSAYFKVIDKDSQLSIIDLEVANYIILPLSVRIEGDHLIKYVETPIGTGYLAVKPGIVRAASPDGSIGSFIRIQKSGYIGLVENRHLENEID
jgi:Zn-dependent peptidase ImmA (M78 family)